MKQRQYKNQSESEGASTEGKMKLSVLLLLALPAASSASPPNIQRRNAVDETSTNGSTLTGRPLLTLAQMRQRRQLQASSVVPSDVGSNLEWLTWSGSLPNNSVSIYNGYVDRVDFVCKYECQAGFYTPSMGPCCNYPLNKAYCGSPFEILVNKDDFEVLEWKDDSHGAVPQNSVRTCPGEDIYVGKDKYGLGKVQGTAFYLPWQGYEYWYSYYQVLTISKDIISQKIYDVKYDTEESKILKYPPEIIRESTINNHECHLVVKTDTLSKTYQLEQRWENTLSHTVGVKTSITASLPVVTSASVEFSTEVTFQFSEGSTLIEAVTDTVSVEITAPPNHSCKVSIVRYKYKVEIPFTASLSRTDSKGNVRTTSITGMYDSAQMGEVRGDVERCELLENAKPC